MDHQLIASLNELSQKVKERKNYEDRIESFHILLTQLSLL